MGDKTIFSLIILQVSFSVLTTLRTSIIKTVSGKPKKKGGDIKSKYVHLTVLKTVHERQ